MGEANNLDSLHCPAVITEDDQYSKMFIAKTVDPGACLCIEA